MTIRANKNIIGVILAAAIAVAAGITGAAVNININKDKATITYSQDMTAPELVEGIDDVEKGQGEIKVDGEEIKTVEAVESNGPVTEINNTNCPEGEECGRGASFPQLDISTPQAFANATLGQCIDVDGYYGAQCWDLEAAFWLNYVGRTLTTCGTGAAKGTIADGCWQINAGNEFDMVWDPTQLHPGDKAVFKTGTWGHIGTVLGYYNNGYITLLGQNQGGAPCPGGGAAANIINISLRDFIGAFRPKIWIQPEPAPEPTPEPEAETVKVVVKAGDTLGQILIDAGYTGDHLFGDDGLAQKIAEKNGIENRGLIYPKQEIVIYKELFSL